jgi:hypothetical protein
MNTFSKELRCPCGGSLLPGSLADDAYIGAWRKEHEGHEAPLAVPEPPLDVTTLCREEGFRFTVPYATSAVILRSEGDALACARGLRKKGWRVVVTGPILAIR